MKWKKLFSWLIGAATAAAAIGLANSMHLLPVFVYSSGFIMDEPLHGSDDARTGDISVLLDGASEKHVDVVPYLVTYAWSTPPNRYLVSLQGAYSGAVISRSYFTLGSGKSVGTHDFVRAPMGLGCEECAETCAASGSATPKFIDADGDWSIFSDWRPLRMSAEDLLASTFVVELEAWKNDGKRVQLRREFHFRNHRDFGALLPIMYMQ